jgi:hypothetical protein
VGLGVAICIELEKGGPLYAAADVESAGCSKECGALLVAPHESCTEFATEVLGDMAGALPDAVLRFQLTTRVSVVLTEGSTS